ncbi:MAG: hypothetical protein GF346_11460 [Candidatus Eisenbacteria bacterium]|nr:hypothetical protein [Candidatus Latescibacterota bacterium]MBD3303053.1 hypothetical protein [Candidatus Eisenbacteria bacterium]
MTDALHAGNGIMNRLREETRALHDRTENGGFQTLLMAGKLPREAYVDSLGQLLQVHRILEEHLGRLAKKHPAFREVVRVDCFQEPQLLADLRHFGRTPASIGPSPATRRFVTWIETLARETPIALLGVFYVLEGSKNGGRFIARAVTKAYALEGRAGVAYLDPHGEEQKPLWQDFKRRMEALDLGASDQEEIVRAACETFAAIGRIYEELASPRG